MQTRCKRRKFAPQFSRPGACPEHTQLLLLLSLMENVVDIKLILVRSEHISGLPTEGTKARIRFDGALASTRPSF